MYSNHTVLFPHLRIRRICFNLRNITYFYTGNVDTELWLEWCITPHESACRVTRSNSNICTTCLFIWMNISVAYWLTSLPHTSFARKMGWRQKKTNDKKIDAPRTCSKATTPTLYISACSVIIAWVWMRWNRSIMNDVGSMNVFKVAIPVCVRTPQLFHKNKQKTRRKNKNNRMNVLSIIVIVTDSRHHLARFVYMEFVAILQKNEPKQIVKLKGTDIFISIHKHGSSHFWDMKLMIERNSSEFVQKSQNIDFPQTIFTKFFCRLSFLYFQFSFHFTVTCI